MAKKFISVCEVVGSGASVKTCVVIIVGLRIILIDAFKVRDAGQGLTVAGAITAMIIGSCRAWALQYKWVSSRVQSFEQHTVLIAN